MTITHPRRRVGQTLTALATLAGATIALTGCVPNAAPDAESIAVTASDTDCAVETAEATSGTVTFTVQNDGSTVNEFYVLGANKLTIIGEVENIAPGASRDLTVQVGPGDYFTNCKPGMIGAGVGQAPFVVNGEAVETSQEDDAVIAQYIGYVKSQTEELVPQVQEFVDAYQAGDDEEAKRLFPLVRISYERIEPTAEQFGDLDPKIDYRKPGALEEGIPFTGFHRIEQDLWLDAAIANYSTPEKDHYPKDDLVALTPEERAELGDQLVADITELKDKVAAPDFTLTLADITEGAKGLLDEVAAPDGKLPGEENEFGHTDLYDFYANVEGAQVAFDTVRPLAEANDASELVTELDERFADMFALLDEYGSYDAGFVFYDTVDETQRAELAASLSALSEPMSKLTAAVVK
ncbi:EfeM/EfeO family lipoprotein [Leucobacter rhizosphaerae]|uniref:EfeM/EfeO family lipoprotein n=1 Tax=Leucobacter rhizosphaerae TaxID=2932245 RepID=A0ABY4FX65_9MICO|nr:iron uptake system protein EfeO [Leucobacter rhizosphaerae]UOQ60857.1 EfeM/EfeO family lipoprotein [Leucobacter rhizosphaerae]